MWSENKEKYVEYWKNTAAKKAKINSSLDTQDPDQKRESSPEKIHIADEIVSCVMEN